MSDLPVVTVQAKVISAVAYIDYNNRVLNRVLSLSESVGVDDSPAFVNQKGLLLADVVTTADSGTQLIGADLSKSLTDSVTTADASTSATGPGINEIITVADVAAKAVGKALVESVGALDTLLFDHGILLTDTVTSADSVAAAIPNTAFNPADTSASVTLSDSNKTITGTGAGQHRGRALTGRSSGKYFFAVSANVLTTGGVSIGISKAGTSLTGFQGDNFAEVGLLAANSVASSVRENGGSIDAASEQYLTGGPHTIGVAVDLDAGQVFFSVDGTWVHLSGGHQDTGTGANAIGGITAGAVYYPAVSVDSGSVTTFVTASPPSGYLDWQ